VFIYNIIITYIKLIEIILFYELEDLEMIEHKIH